MFKDSLKGHTDNPFHPIEHNSIESLEDVVEVTIPDESELKPYKIIPSIKPPTVSNASTLITSYVVGMYPGTHVH